MKILLAFSVIALIFSVFPYFIARSRKAVHTVAILWLSLTMGWTVVGWISAFMWAYMDNVKNPKDHGGYLPSKFASGMDGKETEMDDEELERKISAAMANEDFGSVRQLVGKRKYP